MGTRADFYVGTGEKAEWLGSIAWDGYEVAEKTQHPIRKAKTEEAYRKAVTDLLRSREDGTTPEMGWPWPWNDSGTTDYAYSWDGKKVQWDKWDGNYPDMSEKKNVNFGKRSGLIFIQD